MRTAPKRTRGRTHRRSGKAIPEGTGKIRWILPGIVFLLAACGSEGSPLANTERRLVALGNADAPAEMVGGNPTARFTTATDIAGWTGCNANAYAARYGARESKLRLDDLT